MPTLDFPYAIDATGRTGTTGHADHVRDLIEQVLFTAPGERVMRPDFGSGLLALVFEPNSVQLAATVQVLAAAGLQPHLSHLIALQAVSVEAVDAALVVQVDYALRDDGSPQQLRLPLPGGSS